MEEKRLDKICSKGCKWLMPGTEIMVAECIVDEDVESEKWCEAYEREKR